MKATLIASFAAIAFGSNALAVDRLVPSQYATIQAAIDAAVDGDTIVVSQGNTWSGFSVSGKSIAVRSTSGFARTKVIGGVHADPGVGRVVELNDIAFLGGVNGVSGELRLVGSRHINSGVSVSEPVRLSASGSEFANGSLVIAGAGATPASLDSCHFTLCAQAISVTRQSITLTDCLFDSGGKAISAPNGNVIAKRCGFSSLATVGMTGVCYVSSGEFEDCIFSNCTVTGGADVAAGGAIHAINVLRCTDTAFVSCSVTAERFVTCGGEGCTATAEASGGAIRCGSGSQISACSFSECWARGYAGEFQCASGYFFPRAFGGAVRVVGAGAVLQDCQFLNCRAIAATRVSGACGTDEVSSQALGGAIHLPSAQLSRCSFTGCMLLNETNGSTSPSGSMRMGSAVYGPTGGHLEFLACRFDRNGPSDGSAVAAPNFTLRSCLVTSNGVGNWPSGVPCLVLAGGSPFSEAFLYDSYFGGNAGTPSSLQTTGSSAFAYLSGCFFCGLPGVECAGYWFQKAPNFFGIDCSADCDASGTSDVFQLAIDSTQDCNHNDTLDSCDIAAAMSFDINQNGWPDECECIADVFGDGAVGGADLGLILANWGPSFDKRVPADINADGQVNGADLGIVLQHWGSCGD